MNRHSAGPTILARAHCCLLEHNISINLVRKYQELVRPIQPNRSPVKREPATRLDDAINKIFTKCNSY
jgi:hypothetical protein